MERIDRKSSIENEPRTLKMNQIQFAREEALYVINTTSIEEALRIFTEGLEEPVKCKACEEGDDHKDSILRMENWWHSNSNSNSNSNSDEVHIDEFEPPPLHNRLRDIVSAPF